MFSSISCAVPSLGKGWSHELLADRHQKIGYKKRKTTVGELCEGFPGFSETFSSSRADDKHSLAAFILRWIRGLFGLQQMVGFPGEAGLRILLQLVQIHHGQKGLGWRQDFRLDPENNPKGFFLKKHFYFLKISWGCSWRFGHKWPAGFGSRPQTALASQDHDQIRATSLF